MVITLMILFSCLISASSGTSNLQICSFETVGEQILYSNGTTLFRYDIGSGNTRTIYNDAEILLIDFHYSKGLVYWTNLKTVSRLICPLGNHVTEEIVIQEGDNLRPVGVAVDDVNDHLYWTDMDAATIMRAQLNGSNAQTIVTSLNRPAALRLDSKNGLLYFSNFGDKTIKSCRLDGSNLQTIVSNVLTPYGIAIDYSAQRLYWSDAAIPALKSARLSGSDERNVSVNREAVIRLIGVPVPMGIELYGNSLYFSSLHSGIYKIAKNTEDAIPVRIIHKLPGSYSDLKITRNKERQTSTDTTFASGMVYTFISLAIIVERVFTS